MRSWQGAESDHYSGCVIPRRDTLLSSHQDRLCTYLACTLLLDRRCRADKRVTITT